MAETTSKTKNRQVAKRRTKSGGLIGRRKGWEEAEPGGERN